MAVYKRGYQRYNGPLTGRWTRFMDRAVFHRPFLFADLDPVGQVLAVEEAYPLLTGIQRPIGRYLRRHHHRYGQPTQDAHRYPRSRNRSDHLLLLAN